MRCSAISLPKWRWGFNPSAMSDDTKADTPTKIAAAYQALIADGHIQPDAAQSAAVAALDKLYHALADYQPSRLNMFFKKIGVTRNPAPHGLYIYGAVGRGKSMLMDLFFSLAPVAKKRRVHFHAFMQETHARIHSYRQANPKAGDPMPAVARAIADEVTLLCFDELQVKDIADASILGRLFSLMLEAGIVVVATSNRHPDALYKGGLNRHRFLPFIEFLKQRHNLHELAAEKDYRLARLTAAPVWFSPCGPRARKSLDERFDSLTEGVAVAPVTLDLKGRSLDVQQAAGGVARMGFEALCVQARGAADYLALAAHFHTLVLDNVPLLEPQKKNEAVRFVTLIDALYEAKVKLIASADGAPQKLYPTGDEAFEFERTVSRLMEMQSREYLALPHIAGPGDAPTPDA
ncbi:MAG: AFG1 family ATPase [Alphaproteobacteria bacterium]|nr:AFG1 family ATPase [Alphaproteobacteria bacterium]